MNVRRFVGKNAREAMAQARAACGEQTVVLANRPVPGGVEILAMAGGDVPAPAAITPPAAPPPGPMSTLSLQDYLRERQRKEGTPAPAQAPVNPASRLPTLRRTPLEPGHFAAQELAAEAPPRPDALMAEMKQMRALIAGQLASLSWFDRVRRNPAQTRLLRLMIGNGFSPALARRLVEHLPAGGSETQDEHWLREVLTRNLRCVGDDGIQRRGGVYALVGPTGVGKTTTTAKIAARFALEHGPASVGLVTVDTYRMAASDQLRGFGRLLNIPVHTARDAASLADLLDLFAGKKLVLVDTVGVGQRDRRLAELFAALPARRVARLLVLNAGAQGETLDEVVRAYSAGPGTRCVISKIDEAARCGAAVDVAVRHQLVVEGFANGQRVPEDWHAGRAPLLVQKALIKPASAAYLADDAELGLVLTAPAAGGLHA